MVVPAVAAPRQVAARPGRIAVPLAAVPADPGRVEARPAAAAMAPAVVAAGQERAAARALVVAYLAGVAKALLALLRTGKGLRGILLGRPWSLLGPRLPLLWFIRSRRSRH